HVDDGALDGADAVVHLAGAGIGDRRWTADYRQTVLRSRVDGTTTIARALADRGGVPRLVCASAVGFYGDTGDDAVDETAPRGDGFLAAVVEQWEQAAAAADVAGVAVVSMRTGVVLAVHGGAMGKVLPLFKLGLGGRLGSGRQ